MGGIFSIQKSWRSRRRQRVYFDDTLHKFIPDATSIENWTKLEANPAWNLDNVKSKKRLFWKHKERSQKDHESTKSSMRSVNPETITGTLSWCKTVQLNGCNLTRAKPRLHMIRREVCQNSWNRRTDRKLYKQTTRWNLWQILWRLAVKSPHFNTSSIRDEWHRWKSRPTSKGMYVSSIVAIWLGWKVVGLVLWNAFAIQRNVQDLLADWKSAVSKTIWRTNQRANKYLLEHRNLSWLWADRGRNLERRCFDGSPGRFCKKLDA